MKAWIGIIALLLLAATAAFGWQWIVEDPGYVLLRLRGTSVETSVVFLLAFLLLVWASLSILWRLLRWPLRAWIRARHRRARENLAAGLTAFAEGRYQHAERCLAKATRQTALRGPAYLAMARAAHARGDDEGAARALEQAQGEIDGAVLAQRGRFLVERGRHAEALALLRPRMSAGLVPVALQALIEAALNEGDVQAALDALASLTRTQALSPAAMAALETRVHVAALSTAASQSRLETLWNSVPKGRRREPVIIAAFARRAAGFGQTLAAMDAIESAQRREWSEQLALSYSEIGPAELVTRTRHADAWLAIAPNSPALLTTLGRLCRDQKLWGKGIQYLERAVEIADSAPAWEALGDCHIGAGDESSAIRCYTNALAIRDGRNPLPLLEGSPDRVDTHASVIEERDSHGVPRLPKTG